MKGKDFFHFYEQSEQQGATIIIDHATGLMWQQSGSTENMFPAKAPQHVRDLNSQKFAGYNDWRLPTLEEAMSLIEPTEKNGNLHIDQMFDKTQLHIWTADKNSASAGVAWSVDFFHGYCVHGSVESNGSAVRAVRSGQS